MELDPKIVQLFKLPKGVVYIRIKATKRGHLYVRDHGDEVQVIELKPQQAENLIPLPEVNLIEVVNTLRHPLNAACEITPEAESYLQQILKCEEIVKMETAKKPKFANGVPAKKGRKPGKKTTEASGEKRSRINKEQSITLLQKDNPKREGSSAYKNYELYRKAKTVGDFLEAGGTSADLRYDATHGYIKVA